MCHVVMRKCETSVQHVYSAWCDAWVSAFSDFGSGRRGDGGIDGAGVVKGSCLSNDDMNRTEFLPMFPVSCVFYLVSIKTHTIYLAVITRSHCH
jgi:hypothetical protein